MEYKRFNNNILVRLDYGEDISEKVLEVAEKENIALASVTGIGAVNDCTVGVFNTETKVYDETHLTGSNFEIAALNGTLTTMDGKHYQHLHIVCANSKCEAIGGHLINSKISLTCEIVISVIEGAVNRKFSEKVGINLINFNS